MMISCFIFIFICFLFPLDNAAILGLNDVDEHTKILLDTLRFYHIGYSSSLPMKLREIPPSFLLKRKVQENPPCRT